MYAGDGNGTLNTLQCTEVWCLLATDSRTGGATRIELGVAWTALLSGRTLVRAFSHGYLTSGAEAALRAEREAHRRILNVLAGLPTVIATWKVDTISSTVSEVTISFTCCVEIEQETQVTLGWQSYLFGNLHLHYIPPETPVLQYLLLIIHYY